MRVIDLFTDSAFPNIHILRAIHASCALSSPESATAGLIVPKLGQTLLFMGMDGGPMSSHDRQTAHTHTHTHTRKQTDGEHIGSLALHAFIIQGASLKLYTFEIPSFLRVRDRQDLSDSCALEHVPICSPSQSLLHSFGSAATASARTTWSKDVLQFSAYLPLTKCRRKSHAIWVVPVPLCTMWSDVELRRRLQGFG